MATVGSVHQMGIPGMEDYRPIGIKTTGETKSNKSAEAPKEKTAPAPQDRVELSNESKESNKSSGGFLDNLMKTLNPFD